jgi:WhiB family transcriptional regulator, redox-sensing transcriptional regulator
MDNDPLDVIAQLTHLTVPIGDWHDLARCAETDPELFFPEKGESTRPAKGICRGCEVSAECLQEALDSGERFGVWGGLSERERRVLAVQLDRRPRWARHCPAHGEELSGGPVLYHCPAGLLGHGVTAADLDAAAETRPDAA